MKNGQRLDISFFYNARFRKLIQKSLHKMKWKLKSEAKLVIDAYCGQPMPLCRHIVDIWHHDRPKIFNTAHVYKFVQF